jgi:hypothetical protein
LVTSSRIAVARALPREKLPGIYGFGTFPRMEMVADRLFEEEEAVQ